MPKFASLVLALGLLTGVAGCWHWESGPDGETDPQAPAPLSAEPVRLVVLISLDTVRADHLGLYGHERFTSPSIDTLGLNGAVFEDASATAPWTLPSHASILTGRYPHNHGVRKVRSVLSEDIPTLATTLAAAGFETAAVVNSTWLRKDSFKLTQDFEKYLFVQEFPDRSGPSTWVTDQALEWLRDRGERPLFLFIHYYDVHADYASDPAYEKLFATPYEGIVDGTAWQIAQSNFEPEYIEMCKQKAKTLGCRFGNGASSVDVYDLEQYRLDEADVRYLEQLYDAGIRQLDTEVGRLVAGMRGEGILEEALLVITGDHGEAFMEHGYLDHFIPVYQELLHVPLLFHGPGIPRGVRISQPVSGVDIAPTLLGLLGVEAPGGMDGLDLTPLLRGERPAAFEERTLYGEASGALSHYEQGLGPYFPNYRSLRRGRYKLIYEERADRYALYDLEDDPGEQVDVAEREPEIAEELITAMRERYDRQGASARPENEVELSPEELEKLRSLGYLL